MGSRLPTPLLSAHQLEALRRSGEPPLTLLDVRWELGTGARRDRYESGHIPGAAFLDLDSDLAGPPGAGGRHPLPCTEAFAAGMRTAGVRSDQPVVVYDERPSTAAARAWWLLRYFGHPAVSVLDGGLAGWVAAGGGLATGAETPVPGDLIAAPGALPVLGPAQALALARRGILLDARAPERFRGDSEPIDAVAGHIPGARNRPTSQNLDACGQFLAPAALRRAFEELSVTAGAEVGTYCGSGVTAAHQVLALQLAGVCAALYPGSWSEWITDPERPIATGPAPSSAR